MDDCVPRTIVAIGGGELKDRETLEIDKRIVEFTGKASPRALFIPTASGDPEGYQETFHQVYGGELGCLTDVLCLVDSRPSPADTAEKIRRCDLVYVGGGNSLRMMRLWHRYGVDKLLLEACDRGAVLSGVSAGAICWFRYGHSDSMKYLDESLPFIRVRGLGILAGTFCPHFDSEERREHFPEMIRRRGGMGFAVEDCCALVIRGSEWSAVASRPGANAYWVYKRKREAIVEEIGAGTFQVLRGMRVDR
jgi:dipeptidase E